MLFGAFCGLTAALLNSFGFLVSTHLMRQKISSIALLVYVQIWMLLLSLPVVLFVFPKDGLAAEEVSQYVQTLLLWIGVFGAGQGSLFIAQRYMESSKLTSLLGLKIIVLTVIVILTKNIFPNPLQWLAVCMAAGAGILMNWNGSFNLGGKGMIFVVITLICYSLSDILETNMVFCFTQSGIPTMKSAVISITAAYTALGLVSLPGLFFFKFQRRQFVQTLGYAVPWLLSQIMLTSCFALLLPVFANVLLAMRGAFSVFLGILLSCLGLHGWDAQISRRQWVLRCIAAFFMVAAVAIYSYASMKQ